MKNTGPGEYLTVQIRVSRTDGRAMVATTADITAEERRSLVQLEADEDGRLDVPLPVGRILLLAARDGSCSSVSGGAASVLTKISQRGELLVPSIVPAGSNWSSSESRRGVDDTRQRGFAQSDRRSVQFALASFSLTKPASPPSI